MTPTLAETPVIFLAFANDRDNYLPMVNKERKTIYRSLRRFNDSGLVKVEAEATSQLEDIFEVFTHYHERVALFHYGGHAGGTFLQLEQEDSSPQFAYAGGLAQLLGLQKNLKLVFLNGCATRGQVELLLSQGVKAVIATAVSVEDQMATEFAQLFYNALSGHATIRQAFDTARAFISSKYQGRYDIKTYRSSEWEGTTGTEFPWGLYLNEEAEEVLNWTLPFPETTTYESSNTENRLNRIPSPTNVFVGYEKELAQFESALETFTVIGIEGLGGVGKTEFAIESIKRFVPDRERIIWASPITSFDTLIQRSGYEAILRIEGQREVDKFKNFEGLLDRDNRIVFVEDYHDNEDETYQRFFEQLSLSRARIVVVSRFFTEELNVGGVVRLNGLEDAAILHARNLRDRKADYEEIPDEELETLCRLTEGHPLSMELGMQLLGYGESADDVLDAISGEDYLEHKKVDELSQRLLFSVLEHANTSKRERELLLKLSVFRDRVPLEAIEALFEKGSIKYPLSQLIDKSLIRQRNKLYDSPPLIREFCRTMLDDPEYIHERAADYFLDERTSNFDLSLEENIIYHLSESQQWELLGANIKRNGQLFIVHGQTLLLNRIITLLNQHRVKEPIFDLFRAQILQRIQGEHKKAGRPAKRALSAYRENGDQSGVAYALNMLGEVYVGQGEQEEAMQCYEEALVIALDKKIPAIAVNCYHYLAILQANQGNMETALLMVNAGLALADETDDRFGKANLLNAQGKIFTSQGEYDKSLEARRKSYVLFSEIGARMLMVVVKNNIAVSLSTQGKFKEALVELEECLAIEKEIGARYRIANLYNNIARALLGMNRLEEALLKFQESLQIYEDVKFPFGCAAAEQGIGFCYVEMERFPEALEQFRASLSICQDIGYKVGELRLLKLVGGTLLKISLDHREEALAFYLQAAFLARQMDTADAEIQQQLNLLKEEWGDDDFITHVHAIIDQWPEDQRTGFSVDQLTAES